MCQPNDPINQAIISDMTEAFHMGMQGLNLIGCAIERSGLFRCDGYEPAPQQSQHRQQQESQPQLSAVEALLSEALKELDRAFN